MSEETKTLCKCGKPSNIHCGTSLVSPEDVEKHRLDTGDLCWGCAMQSAHPGMRQIGMAGAGYDQFLADFKPDVDHAEGKPSGFYIRSFRPEDDTMVEQRRWCSWQFLLRQAFNSGWRKGYADRGS